VLVVAKAEAFELEDKDGWAARAGWNLTASLENGKLLLHWLLLLTLGTIDHIDVLQFLDFHELLKAVLNVLAQLLWHLLRAIVDDQVCGARVVLRFDKF
jgi:hypothetical protein